MELAIAIASSAACLKPRAARGRMSEELFRSVESSQLARLLARLPGERGQRWSYGSAAAAAASNVFLWQNAIASWLSGAFIPSSTPFLLHPLCSLETLKASCCLRPVRPRARPFVRRSLVTQSAASWLAGWACVLQIKHRRRRVVATSQPTSLLCQHPCMPAAARRRSS